MTTQPNTEPLKVGEQMPTASDALEALDAMDDYARMDTGVDAIGPREVLRAFIQSHNGHAEPSPAEVSSEMTEEILKLFDSAIDAARSATDSKWSIHQSGSNEHDCRMRSVFESMIIEKRRSIERALNQRLSVKEGEAVAYRKLKHGGGHEYKSAHYADAEFVKGAEPLYTAPLSSQPVQDEQQAKDAALRQARDCINIVWVSHHANRCDAAIEAIDAALSTTKQEG